MSIAIQITFFTMTLLGVVFILFARNVIHAAYALALVLLSLAGVYVFLNAELLAVVQILLYAGGVVILLLFGVMMTQRMRGTQILSESKNVVLSALISLALLIVLIFLFSTYAPLGAAETANSNQIEKIGISFLTEHIVAFELIAFILLVALVGAAYLAKVSSNE